MAEETNNLQKAIDNIEICLDGKHTKEINDLKTTFKISKLEQKNAEQEKDI